MQDELPQQVAAAHAELAARGLTHASFGNVSAIDREAGVAHAHSWAQARRPIPCLGTTHVDYANGPVPCTRELTGEACGADYEQATGIAIVAALEGRDPLEVHDLDATYADLAQRIPLGRMGRVDDVAGWIWFLVARESGWTTGNVIHVDGGQVPGLPAAAGG